MIAEQPALEVTTQTEAAEVTLPPGFRILVRSDSVSGKDFVNMVGDDVRFIRRKDAELAMAALIREGLGNCDALTAAGWDKVKRVMIEALQW